MKALAILHRLIPVIRGLAKKKFFRLHCYIEMRFHGNQLQYVCFQMQHYMTAELSPLASK